MLSRNSFKNGNLKTAHGGNHSFKICFIYDSVGFFFIWFRLHVYGFCYGNLFQYFI